MSDYRERNGVSGGITHNQALPPATPAPAPTQLRPLAPGRYWITAFGTKQGTLDAYLLGQSALGNTHTETTEAINATSDNPAGSFYIFNVLNPVSWMGTVFGMPTKAGANIHTLADTVQRPPEPTPAGQLGDMFGGLATMLTGDLGKMVLAGLVVWAITEGRSNR